MCTLVSFTGLSPSSAGFPKTILLQSYNHLYSPQPQNRSPGLASYDFARHYFRNLVWFPLLLVLRCFTSQRIPSHMLYIHIWMTGLFPAGFPHSDISGSLCICHSPKLFAAYHILHRLLVPRLPSIALITLTFYISPRLTDMTFNYKCHRCPSKDINILGIYFNHFSAVKTLFFYEIEFYDYLNFPDSLKILVIFLDERSWA